ncbi:lanthionine synthetase C family protein [Crassaminicella indica]|uniref:Lanthionine synthetase C family protein n=1 Tax=Crassaminicella indica TaxID=2855394 RepID=A0ABX8RB41_9CLOT|nr:lanthionine synthetase C family protein [Crassaminicella indica]QXM06243.1 lanthionine synthetase C family protein [Crassaminicella indica]
MIGDTNNYIHISENTRDRVNEFLNCFFQYIEEQYDLEIINPIYNSDFLMIISEIYPLIDNKDKWEQMGYDLCKGLKQEIETYGISEKNLGMIGGFGYKCFCVSLFNKKTGNLSKFSNTLNKFFLEQAVEFVERLRRKNDVFMNDYDVIAGVSGFVYFLLDFEWNLEENLQLEKLIKYLIELTNYHEHMDNSIINFHIIKENLSREDEQLEFPNGNINFGLSHGMLGPLVALTKAHNKEIRVEGIENAISTLFDIYDQFKVYRNDIAAWPTQLSFENFIKGQYSDNLRLPMASWCYGNTGIARGLQKAAQYMGYTQKEETYKKDLINIINQPVNRYNLFETILCHGYSSVLCIRMMAYRDTKDERFVKTIEKDINAILDIFNKNSDTSYDMNQIIKNHFENDLSLLQGAMGVVLSLLGVIHESMEYGRVLMVD